MNRHVRRPSLHRRRLLGGLAVTAAGWPTLLRGMSSAARVLDLRVISRQPFLYHGWPTVARRANGELWVVCSGGREAHVCPFGQVVAMCSRDDGVTWSRPRAIHDGPLDDRDAGILETARGSLIATTFTSLAYEGPLEKRIRDAAGASDPAVAEWIATRDLLPPEARRAALGVWALRSTDGGVTWSSPLPTVVNSPHGPIQLADGRLLYAGKRLWTEDTRIGVAESVDDGQTWRWLAEIPTRDGDDPTKDYHELHAVEAADGTLVAQIRNHGGQNTGETLQTTSRDGGRTWSVPRPIGVWGLPSHLLRLRDGRLLMSYGYRRPPFGNQARVSLDSGASWSEPLVISDDGVGGDLGYPSTVQLADGSLLSIWYEKMKEPSKAVLRQARWRIDG